MRYAARMIFEYRSDSDTRKRRTCEARIVVIEAPSAATALRKAKAEGRRGRIQYKNADDQVVKIAFVGLADLIALDPVCEANEVWYSVFTSLNPSALTRGDTELAVFREVPSAIGTAVRFAPRFNRSTGTAPKRRA